MDASEYSELSVEQGLALAYAPRGRSADLAALWELDARMRRLYATAREPAFSEIKLAWWEERLAAPSGPVPAEPLLRRLASMSDRTGIARVALTCFPVAWRAFSDEDTDAALTMYACERGRGIVRTSASIVGIVPDEAAMVAGEGWALHDLARLANGRPRGVAAMTAARRRYDEAGRFTWPRALRPLGMIVELARGDAKSARPPREGSPARVARMAWHAMSGR